MCNDTTLMQQFHSTVQVKLLIKTVINNNKLTHDTLLTSTIIKMLISLKCNSQVCAMRTK